MALQIFIAHSGQRLQTDSGSFPSLDDFKAWVAKNTTVAAQDHISLTAQGKTVRVQDLQTENQIYIYDRRIVQSSSASSPKTLISEISIPSKYNVAKPPDTIADQNDLQAWKDLFMARRSWAYNVLDDCVSMSETTQKRYEEIQIITKCLDTALHNLGKHVRGVDVRNSEVQEWTKGVQEEQAVYGTDWEASLGQLRALPASTQFLKFITGRSFRKSRAPSLEDLIDIEQVKKAGKLTQNLSSQLGRNSSDLGARVDDVFEKADNLQKGVDEVIAHPALKSSDSLQLMQDIEPIAKKIGNDCESILGYSNTSKNLSQASRTALLHTRKFLPDLSQRSIEMDGLLRSATKLRNSIAARSLELMQDIARLTTMLSDLNARFAKFELDSDSFEAINLLSFVHKLPITYASFISESIRRREWSEKVQADSSTLANEMAIFQDEEAKRRKKWQKNTGAELWGDRADSTIMTLQVNLQGEDEQWPQATRQELVDYLAILRNQGANAEVVKHVSKIVADLSNPTKQQSKRTKAFKAGSIHEAALGRSALLVRGDDDLIRVLQEEKSRTEGKLKTAESRVRRLEDLVHRQSHVSRISTGNIFQTNSPSPEAQAMANPMASPRLNDDASRRSSVSSRRFSSNQGTEEKTLQQKLLGIEAELIAERERVSGMEKEISAKNTAAGEMKTQVDEANSTKKDLMENFEAQQREFLEERRSLEAEIKRLKAKLEELEDEMEGAIGSREHVDDRVRLLQDDFEKLRKENAEEAQKAQGQISFLRQEGKLQREANEALQQQLEAMKEENRELLARAERAESAEDEQLKTLEKLHVQLSPNSPIPNDVSSVTDALASMVGDIVAGLESHKRDLAIAKADKDDAESTIAVIKSDIAELTEKLATEEKESTQLRESLDAEQAKFAALEEELSDERLQLSSLRTKIADGETGSEAIRNRLEEEERKVTSLSEDLAAKLSRIGSLEEELRMYQEKSDATRSKFSKLTARFESRTSRAKDLTQRIYSQNDRLCILLEQLSYSVTRAGGSMSIQRIPRPERSSQQNNDSSDPGTSLRRSITSTALTRKALTESADLDLLYWMHNDDSEAESDKYDAFIQAIDSFDVELFSTTIVRRFKDFEHTLKKAVKDMRAYRDKSHSAQKEAHGKIAFKNFKEGDLALFLPTRNQATGAWAAFNVGAPHYFLREQDAHKLQSRDWLLARIHKIEDRVVDLSKSMSSTQNRISDRRSFGETSNGGDSFEDDNPFELSDGLRWYLLEAHEEKPGAPATPGLGKSTVTSTPINASATIHRSKKSVSGGVEGINKTLNKSLESRRSSNNSKQSLLATSKPVQPASGSASLKSIPAGQSKDGPSDTQAIISASRPDANGGDRGKNPENTTNSTAAGTSPSKKSMIFESLWSLDLSLESGKNKK